ncbi:hypothetical protein ACFPPD_15635 [Cohnella suwonensis]|uniref:Uncharacterized protein n=1 Tax=Cohnella suwonensis TaxID=696072 RepID=A0ABW0LWK2_9BACL
MQQFAVVVRELRTLLASFRIVKLILPYHLHILLGGLGIQFLYKILLNNVSTLDGYNTLDTIFNDIPLYLIAYYGFFVGAWLTLVSRNVKYLSYSLWGYAFVILFPFENLRLFDLVHAAIYVAGGYGIFRYLTTAESKSDTQNLSL